MLDPWSRAATTELTNGQLRDRDDKSPTPTPDVRQLLNDLLLQIPRQNQHIVGTSFADLLRWENWDMGTWQELAMFVWIAVHRVVEEIGADAAIVEQRISLAWCAVASDTFSGPLGVDEEVHQAV